MDLRFLGCFASDFAVFGVFYVVLLGIFGNCWGFWGFGDFGVFGILVVGVRDFARWVVCIVELMGA